MYRATGDEYYLEALNKLPYKNGLDWNTVGSYGNIAILTMDGTDKESELYNNIKNKIVSEADDLKTIASLNPYGSPVVKYNWEAI